MHFTKLLSLMKRARFGFPTHSSSDIPAFVREKNSEKSFVKSNFFKKIKKNPHINYTEKCRFLKFSFLAFHRTEIHI